MKKPFYLIFLFSILYGSSSGQENTLENQIMTCQIEIYQNAGFDLNKTIIDYETILIKNEVLMDKTGASYTSLLNRIITDENYQIDSLLSFYKVYPIFKVNRSDETKIRNCEIEQVNNYKNSNSKWIEIGKKIDSIGFGEGDASKISKILLGSLSDDDFEMDFYKLKTFLAIEMVNSKYGSRKLLPPIISNEN